LNSNDVPAGAILTLEQSVSQEQVKHRNTFSEVYLDGVGDLSLFNMTAKFSKTPGTVNAPPPTLGQHTQDVLSSIGYTGDDIMRFKNAKII
jgi:crotonobetainyl-CoA:carnitine CoA-transferase CaiB-like acyl-CoA transferase